MKLLSLLLNNPRGGHDVPHTEGTESSHRLHTRRTRSPSPCAGIKLNYAEAAAIICDEVYEEARAGRPYEEVVAHACSLLTRDDVLPGVPEMLSVLYIDALFPDGTRLVTVRNPIR